jgi:hypothetical protein
MATKRASGGTKSTKKKTTARAGEARRMAGQDRAAQRPKVAAGQKARSQGRYPGSTPTADDELRRGNVREARGSKTSPLATAKRSHRPGPRKGTNAGMRSQSVNRASK